MGLKAVLEKLEDAPEAVRSFYEERDGKFHLALEGDSGFVPASKLHEFRDSNRKLNAELKAAAEKLKQYDGVDPDEYRKLKDTTSDDKPNGQAIALQKRIEALEASVKAEQEKASAAEQRLAQTKISDVLRKAAQKLGVHPEMIDDVIELPAIRGPWALDDKGNPVARDGDSVIYGKDATAPIAPEEFLQGRLKKAYLQPSNGAGSQGGNGRPAGAKQVRRADFDVMPPDQQRDFIINQKGAVVD